ncbi:MAG TPA: PD-(D/E)XK nuclease family protein [Termitinemataceae bacterium]|nr:PD-(D/E)XK nuclease family protein [Termitinemataceae bacterium]HOM24180.1 PD-(D/E)XK nuclease family protein [Termitinemataceae bacterium]HPQ01161.1 PD-(D/E)XK nuclease family protein [Termitinemataceae bacterium]
MDLSAGVLPIILNHLQDRTVRFVFPSSVVARHWAETTCVATGKPLDLRRFIAWDVFKEEALSQREEKLRPANRLLRLLFATHCLRENKTHTQEGKLLLYQLIPHAYAAEYQVFVPYVAELLPALKKIVEAIANQTARTKQDGRAGSAPEGSTSAPFFFSDGLSFSMPSWFQQVQDPYYRDVILLYHWYAQFLTKQGFFEPSWREGVFSGNPAEWIIFFPELLEDWDQFEGALPSGVKRVPLSVLDRGGLQKGGAGDVPENEAQRQHKETPFLDSPAIGPSEEEKSARLTTLLRGLHQGALSFSTIREEVRFVVLLLRELLQRGLYRCQDILISIPELEKYRELLQLESALRDVPLQIQQGRFLAELPGGSFFLRMQEVEASLWSYDALRYFLEDGAIPWKERKKNLWLLEFGKLFRCLAGFREGETPQDVWLETFKKVKDFSDQDLVAKGWYGPAVTELEAYYQRLKRQVQKCLAAPSFEKLKKYLDEFITAFIDRSVMDDLVDPVFAIAQDELEQLIRLETSLQDFAVENPYALFIQHLKQTPYVTQGKGAGIRVYPYRVAAGCGGPLHIVMNASQDALSVAADEGPLVREDRKAALGIKNKDLTPFFIEAYKGGSDVVFFTVPQRTLDGSYCLPHQALRIVEWNPGGASSPGQAPRMSPGISLGDLVSWVFQQDPYEKRDSLGGSETAAQALAATRLARRHYPQGGGHLWYDLRRESLEDSTLLKEIQARFKNEISPSSLNLFLRCPYAWFLQQALRIQELETEVVTVDARDEGLVYHAILEGFFKELQKEGTLERGQLERYQKILDTHIEAVRKTFTRQEGVFQEEVYNMLITRIGGRLRDYLAQDMENLSGHRIVGVEFDGASYALPRKEGEGSPYRLAGRIDLLTMDREGNLMITDFKRKRLPDPGALLFQENTLPSRENRYDLQIAAYIRMVEHTPIEAKCRKVNRARLYSLEEGNLQKVIDPIGSAANRRRLPVTRDDYEATLEMVDWLCEAYIEALESGDFPVPDLEHQEVCEDCSVRSVCRVPFAADRLSGRWKGYAPEEWRDTHL